MFAVFIDLEKACHRTTYRKGLWVVLQIYGVGRHLLERIGLLNKNASASVRVNQELSKSIRVGVSQRQSRGVMSKADNI